MNLLSMSPADGIVAARFVFRTKIKISSHFGISSSGWSEAATTSGGLVSGVWKQTLSSVVVANS